jgi:phosphoglucomutase
VVISSVGVVPDYPDVDLARLGETRVGGMVVEVIDPVEDYVKVRGIVVTILLDSSDKEAPFWVQKMMIKNKNWIKVQWQRVRAEGVWFVQVLKASFDFGRLREFVQRPGGFRLLFDAMNGVACPYAQGERAGLKIFKNHRSVSCYHRLREFEQESPASPPLNAPL